MPDAVAAPPTQPVAPVPDAKVPTPASLKAKPPVAVRPPAPTPPPAARVAAKPALALPPAVPALDLSALERRLRDTRAIGLFTKLSLKNQVDDLLDVFRAHHRGASDPPLASLRQRYDLLMLKVLTLLQDGDPPLATAISASREAIWGLLNDPAKLTAI